MSFAGSGICAEEHINWLINTCGGNLAYMPLVRAAEEGGGVLRIFYGRGGGGDQYGQWLYGRTIFYFKMYYIVDIVTGKKHYVVLYITRRFTVLFTFKMLETCNLT
jgi:hypothetical protein